MSRQHGVVLSLDQVAEVERFLRRRDLSRLQRSHARMLLLANTGGDGVYLTDVQIGQRVGCSRRTVARVRETFATRGLDAAIARKPRADTPQRRFTADQEARVIQLVTSPAPDGHVRWSVRLLTDEVIARGIVPTVSRETIRQTLKKGAVRLT